MKISTKTNIILIFIFMISVILSGCTPLLKKKSSTAATSTEELPQPKKVYKGFKIPSGPMDTEKILITQAKAAAESQARHRAELLKRKKQKQNLTGEKSQMLTIEQIEAKQAKDAAKKNQERRARMKANRLKVETQKEEQMLARLETKRQKEADENRRLKEAQDRQKARDAQLALDAKLQKDNVKVAQAKKQETDRQLALQEKADKEKAIRLSREQDLEKKRQLALQEKTSKAEARKIAQANKEAALLATKKLKQDQGKINIVNSSTKTQATKKKLVETEKEKALRKGRETLALQREDQGYKATPTKRNPTTRVVRQKENNPRIVNTTKGVREKISHSGAQPLAIGQPKVDFAEVPMTAVAPPKVSPGAKLPKGLVSTKRSIPKKSMVESIKKIDLPSNTLKDFYFPIENLEAAKAYRYIAEGDFPDTTYWLMKALAFNGKTFLITETYNAGFQLTQSVKEVVNENGVFMMDYTSFEVDGMGEVNNVIAGVDDDESFKWNMSKGDKIAMGLNYNSSLYPNYDITTYRERTFVNESENVIFNGQALRTVMFEDKETAIFTDNKDEQETYASTYFNQYAEGVGLVKYVVNKNSKDNSEFKTYKLNKIMSYDEWKVITKPHQKR